MESLLLLIPLSALVIIGAAAVFWWAVDAGQFEDVERQGRHSLFDESLREEPRSAERGSQPHATMPPNRNSR